MNLAHLLARSARTFPERPAVFLRERLLHDYRTLALRAAAIARHLRNELKPVPGDRVVIFMRNRPEYLELMYAILWAGLVAVPVNARLHPKELVWIVENAQARLLFAEAADVESTMAAIEPAAAPRVIAPESSDYAAMLAAAPLALEHRAPDELAWLFYTSGTTGRPKGVMLTHRNLLAMALTYFADVDPVEPDDTTIYAAPMSHGAGLYNFMFVMKAARHVVPQSGGFDPAELLALANQHGNVCLFAAPTMVKRLVDHVAGEPRRLQRLQDHRLRRRADVRGGHPPRARRDGQPVSCRSAARANRR
jgi:long-chain acyl-CoA synthetase